VKIYSVFTKNSPANQICYREMQLPLLDKCSIYPILSMQFISTFLQITNNYT